MKKYESRKVVLVAIFGYFLQLLTTFGYFWLLGNTLRYLEQGPPEKELDFLAEQVSLLTAADSGAGTVQEDWPNGFFKVFLVGQNKV